MKSAVLRSSDFAPSGEAITDYDCQNLAVYAALLDAAKPEVSWQALAKDVLCIDPNANGAEASVHSHLKRARWIIGDGLGSAIAAFSRRSFKADL